MIKLLIADDHAIVRKGLKLVLSTDKDIDVLGEAIDGEEVLEKIKVKHYDVILLDIDMPKINGITAIRHIKKISPKTEILILSMHPEEVYAMSAIQTGASGFVSKDSETEVIVSAIKKVARGEKFLSPELAKKLAKHIDKTTNVSLTGKFSTREMEVLKLLSSGKTNKDIAEELQINEKTVSTYKTRLMKKMGVSNTVDLIKYAGTFEN